MSENKLRDPNRDCPHGRQKGKCPECEVTDLEARVEELDRKFSKIRESLHHGFGGDLRKTTEVMMNEAVLLFIQVESERNQLRKDLAEANTEIERLMDVDGLGDGEMTWKEKAESYREDLNKRSIELAEAKRDLGEADRRAGTAERERARLEADIVVEQGWLLAAKFEAGYPMNTSFDAVWKEVLDKAKNEGQLLRLIDRARHQLQALRISIPGLTGGDNPAAKCIQDLNAAVKAYEEKHGIISHE